MTPETWARLRHVFARAMDADVAGRQALLAELRRDDAALAAELEHLLAAVGDLPTEAEPRALPLDDGEPPERVDRYRLVSELGRGGMGRVFLAERADGVVAQRVALKLLTAGRLTSPEARQRFLVERQILARLDHPGIARLIDGGTGEDGQPFLVMEHVDGEAIDAWCASRQLGPEDTVRLFLRVCAAVEAAHRNLVVHRDLKPSNVLVTADGEPRLLDFGIAKLLAPTAGDPLFETHLGQAPLTPRYAAPEQVRGEVVTVATDVYALGVMLFELLTGESPYGDATGSPASLIVAICQHDPRPPSRAGTRTGTAKTAPAPRTRPPRRQRIDADLDAIVLKALRKEPAARYGTVAELAADLQRFLDGRPVAARQGSRRYRAAKFLRRHRLGVAAAATVAFALVGAAATSYRQARVAAAERDRAVTAEGAARRQAATAAQVVDFLVELYEQADPVRTQGRPPTVAEVLDTSRERLLAGGPEDPAVRAALLDAVARAYLGTGQAAPAKALAEQAVGLAEGGSPREAAAPALLTLGRAQRILGDLPAAERALRSARAAALAAGGGERPVATLATRELVSLLTDDARFEEARTLALGMLAEAAAPLAVDPAAPEVPDGPLDAQWGELSTALYHLAHLDMERGDLPAAIATHRRALAVGRRVWGEDDSRVAKLLMALGDAYDEADQVPEAAAIYGEGVAAFRRVYGEGHIELGKALVNYGGILRRASRPGEAIAALDEAVALFTAAVGRDHHYTSVALNNLANSWVTHGDLERALAIHREALAVRRRLWPEPHPEIAQSLRNIGSLHIDLGRPAEGVPFLEQACAGYEATLGPRHPRSLDGRATLGLALGEAGAWRRSREVLEAALAAAEGVEAPLVRARLTGGLAEALDALGSDPARALELARQSLAIARTLEIDPIELDLAKVEALAARLERRAEASLAGAPR